MGSGLIRFSKHGGVAFVTIRGAVDRQLAPHLRDVLAWAVENHEGAVVDLSGATAIDRSGLGVLLQSQDRAHLRETGLCFAEPSPELLTALKELHAEAMFAMFDDCADAVTWLRANTGRQAA